jgi:hypothetical protein
LRIAAVWAGAFVSAMSQSHVTRANRPTVQGTIDCAGMRVNLRAGTLSCPSKVCGENIIVPRSAPFEMFQANQRGSGTPGATGMAVSCKFLFLVPTMALLWATKKSRAAGSHAAKFGEYNQPDGWRRGYTGIVLQIYGADLRPCGRFKRLRLPGSPAGALPSPRLRRHPKAA